MSPAALLEIEEKAEDLIDLGLVEGIMSAICALDGSQLDDDGFAILERIIDNLIKVLSITPNVRNRQLIERLFEMRAGVEQGLSPDPAKRPTAEQMRAFVASHIR